VTLHGTLDVSTSGLVAQRTALKSQRQPGQPQDADERRGRARAGRRCFAVFAVGDRPAIAQGVTSRRSGSTRAALPTLNRSPADPNGYVYYPNVDPTVELMNGMERNGLRGQHLRVEAIKSMVSVALQIIA
jgi:hypothetical protein